MVDIPIAFDQLGKLKASNQYTLTIDNLNSSLSVLSLTGEETLNQPWRYEVIVTSTDKSILVQSVLAQKATLTFNPKLSFNITKTITFSDNHIKERLLHGVVSEFSQIAVNKEEAHYKIVLEPRLVLLNLNRYSAIYQNQSVIAVVEEVLRKHGFTGVDYRLELKEAYPAREFITQWQESDLTFIQRILADIGVWFRFESDAKHHCDVLVISDYEQGLENAGSITFKQPTGTNDGGTSSVWSLQTHSKMVTASVLVQDYNYRQAQTNMSDEVNTQPKDETTYGIDYGYSEHYKQLGSETEPESGLWYAKIRHQRHISEQILIKGTSNEYTLTPGQRVLLKGHPLSQSLTEGVMILSIESVGDRVNPYELRFTAIPFDLLKPYRPNPLPWPEINGTLPARVTSPDNDTYGYIDVKGRYRVKFEYDLKTWKNGEESLWVRLAKPYAGNLYGFHFPLINGTEVAIAFTEGNPDRPYIAYALHDSSHPDHVSTANKHRNVIRTPANNKLRMDDKRGQEHIKLATEYGKTQINLGHLVDKKKKQRGEGFELRTDQWGAIAAQKGLYLTTDTQAKAQGNQLDMQEAIAQLENALSIAKSLQNAAKNSQAHLADIPNQQQLKTALSQLSESGILGYAQQGIGLLSPKNIQLSSAQSISLIAEKNTDISTSQTITLAAEKALGFFAQHDGIKMFASQGKTEIQAQNDAMDLIAKQNIKIDSVDGSVLVTASKDLTFVCGGSYIKIDASGIELGTSGNVRVKSASLEKIGPSQINLTPTSLPVPFVDNTGQLKLFYHDSDLNPIPRVSYRVEFDDGSVREGILDDNGEALLEDTPLGHANVFFGYSTDDAILPSLKEYETEDYSKTSVAAQLQEHINITPEELKAYIDSQLAYTEEYLEIGKQKQGKE